MSFKDRLNRWARDGKGNQSLGRVVFLGLLITSVLSFFLLGAFFNIDSTALEGWMAWAADNPMSLFVVVGVYVVLSFLGTPQFLLFAVTGAVLPPFQAFTYGWTATMIAATIHFFIGRQFSDWIRAASGKRLRSLKQVMSRNGIVASAVLRNIPAGPFIFVNIVCGASGMRGHHFLIGTSVGIIPKAAALIFLGINLGAFLRDPTPQGLAIIGAVLIAVFLVSLGLTKVFRRFEEAPAEKTEP